MTEGDRAFIVGAYEHPSRRITDQTVPEVLAQVAYGALADAGLLPTDVDGFFCSSEEPGHGSVATAEYLGLSALRYLDTTEEGGASYPMHVGHAARAIAAGRCSVALVTMGGIPSSAPRPKPVKGPEFAFEDIYGTTLPSMYALAARRHMHEFGTTSAQLAEIRVAAGYHAQFNPNAVMKVPVTVDEVLDSPMISDPLHRLDCCLTTDGGGALVIVSEAIAKSLSRPGVWVRGQGESIKIGSGRPDLTFTGAVRSAPLAYDEAGVSPADIDYASIYDSFTITVLQSLEDLGFCEKGDGGRFVQDGALLAPFGKLPLNTDGGGLCNNHPDFRGGMIRTIEAVRQLRGEANHEVQVLDCELALVQAHGFSLGTRSASSTMILERVDL